MQRPTAACAVFALAFVLVPFAAAASPAVDFLTPTPAQPATARLAVASGSGSHRLAVWTATNSRAELCVGWVLGASKARPAQFTCLRRGLERPVLTVEGGGGLGGQVTWGALVGFAAPGVGRVSVTEGRTGFTHRDLALVPLPWRAGWRVFTTGMKHRPPDRIQAYGATGETLVDDVGIWIHPSQSCNPCPISPPGRPATGSPWTDTDAVLGQARHITPEFTSAAATQATATALAHPGVRSVLLQHPAWLEETTAWASCRGRPLGWVVVLRSWTPASFTGTLPVLGKAEGKFAYSTGVQEIRATNWTQMNVFVDMNVGAVVGVDARSVGSPGLPQGETETLRTIAPPHDSGGPADAEPCPRGD